MAWAWGSPVAAKPYERARARGPLISSFVRVNTVFTSNIGLWAGQVALHGMPDAAFATAAGRLLWLLKLLADADDWIHDSDLALILIERFWVHSEDSTVQSVGLAK